MSERVGKKQKKKKYYKPTLEKMGNLLEATMGAYNFHNDSGSSQSGKKAVS